MNLEKLKKKYQRRYFEGLRSLVSSATNELERNPEDPNWLPSAAIKAAAQNVAADGDRLYAVIEAIDAIQEE